MERNCFISPVRKKRLHEQGYEKYTDTELFDMRIGLRFAYLMCGLLVFTGMLFKSVSLFSIAMIVAFFGAIFHTNPFDLIYNYGIRYILSKPKVPPRSNQGRFACALATVWLAGVIYLFSSGLFVAGYLTASVLLSFSLIVSLLDICVPSILFNFIFKKR